jgi:hypothetical protein
MQSHDSSVGIVTGYGLDDWGSGAQLASYPVGTGGSFPGDKAVWA